MENRSARKYTGLLLALAVWSCFWLFPWQPWLEHHVWVKMALGLSAFILPGFLIIKLLQPQDPDWIGYIPFGFSISLLIVTVLGLIARSVHLSMSHIVICFWVVGIISLGLVFQQGVKKGNTGEERRVSGTGLKYTWPILVVVVLIGLITTLRIIGDDDLIYQAYQNYFEKSASLDFKEIVFGYDEWSPARFWIVSIPFAQALISRITHIPAAMFALGYYDPFLVLVSAIAFYCLSWRLGLSPGMAALSVVFQFTFMVLLSEYLHAGAPFLKQLGTDKATAAFILAPVFLDGLHRIFKGPNVGSIVAGLLAALSLSAAHPVIFAFAGFIAGLTGLLAIDRTSIIRRILIPAMILLMAMLPQVAVRFSGSQSTALIDQARSDMLHQEETDLRIRLWGSRQLYGLNPSLLAIHIPYEQRLSPISPDLLHFGWLVFPALVGLFTLKDFRKEETARYILASLLLVLLVIFPFTGPIFGTLTTPGMLERTVWLFPFGTALVYLLARLCGSLKIIKKGRENSRHDVAIPLQIASTVICTAVILLYMRETKAPDFDQLRRREIRYQDLVDIGSFLDRENDTNFWIAGSDKINDLIPIFTTRGKVISFRPSDRSYSYFIPAEAHNQRMLDRQSLFSGTASMEEILAVCKKYQISYLLFGRQEFGSIERLVSMHPETFTAKMETRSFVLLSLRY